jgi:cardiolipin synthase
MQPLFCAAPSGGQEIRHIARAGVDVRIVTPASSDVQSAVYAARAAYGDLREAGVRGFEMRDAVVHAKLAVVDDTWTALGSSNLDRRSVMFNNEVDTTILGHDTARTRLTRSASNAQTPP